METNTAPAPEIYERKLTWEIIGSAMEVHRALGPGLLESIYSSCLAHELASRGIPFIRERSIGVCYKDLVLEHAFRADFVVADRVIVEVKAVDDLSRAHVAQTLTYLKAARIKVGLLFNFNCPNLRQGMRRLVL